LPPPSGPSGLRERRLVGPDGGGKPGDQRIRCQFVADRGFGEMRHRGDEVRQIVEVEIVPGVDHEPQCGGA
jgi:hypothetical protein